MRAILRGIFHFFSPSNPHLSSDRFRLHEMGTQSFKPTASSFLTPKFRRRRLFSKVPSQLQSKKANPTDSFQEDKPSTRLKWMVAFLQSSFLLSFEQESLLLQDTIHLSHTFLAEGRSGKNILSKRIENDRTFASNCSTNFNGWVRL